MLPYGLACCDTTSRVTIVFNMAEELYTVEEAAKLLKLHVDTIRRLLRDKKLKGVKIGGGRQWRIPSSEIAALSKLSTNLED